MVGADLDMEKARLGEMQQLDVISKAIAYSNTRKNEAEVRKHTGKLEGLASLIDASNERLRPSILHFLVTRVDMKFAFGLPIADRLITFFGTNADAYLHNMSTTH